MKLVLDIEDFEVEALVAVVDEKLEALQKEASVATGSMLECILDIITMLGGASQSLQKSKRL